MDKKKKKARAAARCAARHAESVEVSSKEAFLEETSKNATKIRQELAAIMVAATRIIVREDCYSRLDNDRKDKITADIQAAVTESSVAFAGTSYVGRYDGWYLMRSFKNQSLEDVYGPLGSRVGGEPSLRQYVQAWITPGIYTCISEGLEKADSELIELITPMISLF